MKKRNVTLWGLLLGCLFGANLFAQVTVNYPAPGGASANFTIAPPGTCSFNFFDNGGAAANYSNGHNNTIAITFAPSAPANKVQATFSAFAVESGWDALYVFDGASVADPLINSGLGATVSGFPAGGWQGTTAPNNLGAGIVRATAGNASGALTFRFGSDGSVSSAGWAAAVVEVAPGACAMTAPANVTASTSAGVCAANSVTVNAPSFSPAGCNTAFSLQYRINGGAAVVIGSVVPATVAVTNVPKGVNTITWQLVNACGGAVVASATSTITVNDLTPPVVTCPANITINLGPGECAAPYSYSVTATDNCPSGGPITTLNTITAANNGNAAGGMVYFNLVNNSALPILVSAFRVNITNGSNINVYTKNGTHVGSETNAGAWTLTSSANANVGPFSGAFPGNGTLTNAPLATPFFIAPGATTGVGLHMLTAASNYTNGTGANQTYTDGTLTLNAGYTSNGFFVGGFTPRVFNGGVTYQTFLPAPPVTQTAGLPSGAEFPVGTICNTFSATDAAGLVATCSFCVTVNEYPNAITSLACNDLVQISLDENCSAVINADQVLEGGPYGCYDDYIVEVDRTISGPAANGPWTPAVLGAGDVNKTYYYRVTDPATGNSCWGQLKIEDKLPPVLVCRDLLVECNGTPTAAPAPALDPIQSIIYTGLSDIIEANTSPLNYSFDFGYIPAGTPALDVNVRLKLTGHTWLPDLNVIAINPQGQQISAMTIGGCIGQEWPIDCVFDDEGLGGITLCTQLNAAGAPLQCLTGGVSIPGKLSGFDGANASGNWTVRVTDSFAGDDGVVEEVGLIITVDVPAIDIVDNCGGVLTLGNGLSYVDQHTNGSCAGAYGTTVRTWTAVDASGNVSTCNQTITFLNPELDDVVLPGDYDGVDNPALECGGVYPTPAYLNALGLEGSPTVFGSTFGCTINWEYEDLVLPVCDGTYKIKRTWTIVDWCAGTGFDYVQLIKVHDSEGPSIACPANMTVSTDPYTCCATVDLPNVIVSDNCSRINNVGGYVVGFDPFTGEEIGTFPFGGFLSSFPGNNLWNPDTLANFGLTACLPLGTHTVYYEAEDDCGNVSTCSFRLTVRDYTPPVAACDEYTVVGIGLDDPFDCYWPNAQPGDCNAGGVTWVKATTFDDGSYDNCGDVHFTVQRMGPDYSDCILALNGTNGYDVNGSAPEGPEQNCFDIFADFPSEFERAITEYDSIKFYCCEVGTTQTVVLRVYQLDADGNISVGPDGTPVFNSCMVQVEVQDKIKPACQAPANVVVSCESFDPSLWAYGNAVPSDNCCLDTTKVYQGQCGLSHTTVLTNFDSLCNKGTITRRWTAYDCHGLTSQCTQRIIVNYEQDYYVKFPSDRLVSTCDGTGTYGAPEFYGEDCELLATSFVDEIFTVVPDACFKIERTWTVINWCTYNPNVGCTYVPNPNPSNTTNAPANLAGVTVSAPGTTILNWNPTVVKINAADPTATNYSIFWSANANCYQYKQIIKVYDTQDPTVVTPTPAEFCDYSTNDANFWNASYWWDATISSHDLCEGDANIELTATDACSGANISFRYLLFLDLDGNGSMETVVNSVNPPGFNNINFNNAGNANYAGGEARQFDGHPVPGNQKWGFGLQTDAASGNNRTARVRWFNQLGQNAVPQLPYGTHKIKWFVEDGCGNELVTETTFVVKDCKKPTVVCLNGLSVNLMNIQGGMVQLWASDFLQYTEDNCTPSAQLKIGIRRSGTGTGFPVNADGTPQTGVTFTCADLGTQLVELWSIDKAGNADFCETYVLIQDNAGVCGNNADVAGALETNTANEGVENATVTLEGSNNGTPLFSEIFTGVSGNYAFSNALPIASNATVTPLLELDPLNGVNTYDLILISRHILGLEPLNTPYKLISADANKSGTVTTFDVVELRKLILGTYTELPGNSSWRFVDKSQNFANPANPFAEVIRENLSIAAIQGDIANGDFVGVKVGDVDETATPNTLVASDDRTTGTLLFDVQDRAVKAGETFAVNFKAANKAQGYQFTMGLNGLEVAGIVPGANMSTDNFGVFANALTTSADGTEGEFTVNFRAKADGQLSQMINVSSSITKAVAFDATSSKLDVAFRFNNGGVSTISGVGFELYQNSPNPFVNKTFVGFHLPEATSATLSVYDETGRVLYTTTGDFAKGYNAITLDRANLRANGVLYYKLETTTDSATKKMIQTK